MCYSEEEISKYLNILFNYDKGMLQITTKSKCKGCPNTTLFDIVHGHKICVECGTSNGAVLGIFDLKDLDRLYYRKKSIYHRKYHYEKKVNQISKRINLDDEEKYELYSRLLTIDNQVMDILNKKYFRKRLINIAYLIKRLLEEMGCEKYKLVTVKISPQSLSVYEKWWESYKELKK